MRFKRPTTNGNRHRFFFFFVVFFPIFSPAIRKLCADRYRPCSPCSIETARSYTYRFVKKKYIRTPVPGRFVLIELLKKTFRNRGPFETWIVFPAVAAATTTVPKGIFRIWTRTTYRRLTFPKKRRYSARRKRKPGQCAIDWRYSINYYKIRCLNWPFNNVASYVWFRLAPVRLITTRYFVLGTIFSMHFGETDKLLLSTELGPFLRVYVFGGIINRIDDRWHDNLFMDIYSQLLCVEVFTICR